MKRLTRYLSSPRFAVWLIVAISLYSAVATMVPQRNTDPADHVSWMATGGLLAKLTAALGLDHAFSAPIFLVLALLLVLSTFACSIKRTRTAIAQRNARGSLTPAILTRLREHSDLTLEMDLCAQDALVEVERRLRPLGLKSRLGPRAGYAESRVLGLFGSPLFHWSLVALIATIAVGQVTRWEGMVAVPQGADVEEVERSYGKLDRAPLALPHTGWTLRLVSVDESYQSGGISYGWTPTVAVVAPAGRTVTQRVHPNQPLRHGPLLVHSVDYGLSARIDVLDANGTLLDSLTLPFDFDEGAQSGTETRTAEVSLEGAPFEIDVSPDARDLRGDLPRVRPPRPTVGLVVRQDGQATPERTLGVGQSVDVSGGALRLADVGYYARLTVVRDWSVDWIYLLMGLATLAMTLTLLFPYRSVWFLAEEQEGATRVSVVVREGHRNRAFKIMVSEALAKQE